MRRLLKQSLSTGRLRRIARRASVHEQRLVEKRKENQGRRGSRLGEQVKYTDSIADKGIAQLPASMLPEIQATDSHRFSQLRWGSACDRERHMMRMPFNSRALPHRCPGCAATPASCLDNRWKSA
jgi:hypothetical protein